MYSAERRLSRLSWGLLLVCLATVAHAAVVSPNEIERFLRQSGDLHVVDCLLPGKVRRLGRTTYLGPRRPVRTTAADCRIKGGEYTAYDRADYRTALKVWLASAQQGDAQAQVNVGEIYERGLGGEPNYEAAREWYQRAAVQGNTRAQFALGTLFEQGLGVPQSRLEALNWYRRAWGIEDDNLVFASAMRQQLDHAARALHEQVLQKDRQIEALQGQLQQLQAKLSAAEQADARARTQLHTLQELVAQLEQQRVEHRTELSALLAQIEAREVVDSADEALRLREPADAQHVPEPGGGAQMRAYADLELGGYYALLIGNADYDQLESLQTPLNDVARAGKVLREKYGFTVFTLDNGNSIEVMQAINNLSDVLTEQDNLLLFFAGHGSRLQIGANEAGYWLPRNAERPPRNTFWVSNEFVSGHLSRIRARRVLVVADSCYAGLLAGEPSLSLMGLDAPQYTDPEFLRFKLSKRSRLLLSSGGDRPVLDQGEGDHSVFANAFLTALEDNDGLMASPQLFLKIRDQVRSSAGQLGFEQNPALKSIKSAGHEVGDFFFLAQREHHK